MSLLSLWVRVTGSCCSPGARLGICGLALALLGACGLCQSPQAPSMVLLVLGIHRASATVGWLLGWQCLLSQRVCRSLFFLQWCWGSIPETQAFEAVFYLCSQLMWKDKPGGSRVCVLQEGG